VSWIAARLDARAAEVRLAWIIRMREEGILARMPDEELSAQAERVQAAWQQYLASAGTGEVGGEPDWGEVRRALAGWSIEDALGALLALRAVCRDLLATEDAGRPEDAIATFERIADRFITGVISQGVVGQNLQHESECSDRQQAEVLQRVIAAQEEERKRIARELHDQTGQSLTSLMIGLRRLEAAQMPEEERQAIAELQQNANRALDELHHLIFELRPSVLEDLGLVVALQRYIEEFARRTGLRVETELDALAGVRLEPAVEIALYRIVQEALTNVDRHARATTASVLLQCRGDSLLLIVEDDGSGFVVPEIGAGDSEHFGLMGMQERAALIGGKLTIESSPGAGTTIYVEVPRPGCKERSAAPSADPRAS
jgi:signal transduction histidine kinase